MFSVFNVCLNFPDIGLFHFHCMRLSKSNSSGLYSGHGNPVGRNRLTLECYYTTCLEIYRNG